MSLATKIGFPYLNFQTFNQNNVHRICVVRSMLE